MEVSQIIKTSYIDHSERGAAESAHLLFKILTLLMCAQMSLDIESACMVCLLFGLAPKLGRIYWPENSPPMYLAHVLKSYQLDLFPD